VLKLNPTPLSDVFLDTEDLARNVPRFPIDLYMCNKCYHVQQLDVVNPDILWKDFTYQSGQGAGIPEHFENIANLIHTSFLSSEKSFIIDIGSNDGLLLSNFIKHGHRVLGIDPAADIAQKATENGIFTIPNYLTIPLAQDILVNYGKANVVCMFNAFAHVDNLHDILESIKIMLSNDGIFIFESQYLLDIIQKNLIATIFHEHISHHSLISLIPFFESHDLQLIDVKRIPIQHGSIIGFVKFKNSNNNISKAVDNLLSLEKKFKLNKTVSLFDFADNIYKIKHKIDNLSKKWEYNKFSIFGYGAARSAVTLISQFNLSNSINFIIDDHPQKVNKYSPGDAIKIIPTSNLLTKMPNITIILAWVHENKIINNNKKYLQKGGKFLTICPDAKLISQEGEIKI
jgi:2-polyprenyl-3-methyl-5-hydroxy-6-metoxy-1,4-benzoquinol methylase